MPRISVSLPEELIRRLEPIKDRINISQVCREALERRAAAFERAAEEQGDDTHLVSLIARLREEKEVVEGKFEELGRRAAAVWLSTASYAELSETMENQSTSEMDKYRLPRPAFRIMRRDMKEAAVSSEGAHAVAYKTAWLDYVRSVWSQVAHPDEP